MVFGVLVLSALISAGIIITNAKDIILGKTRDERMSAVGMAMYATLVIVATIGALLSKIF